MTNPYLPPGSEITAPETSQAGRFWKVFFWFHVALLPLLVIGVGMMVNSLSVFDALDLLTFPVILLGLYGYAYGKAFSRQGFWKAVAYAYPVWVVFYEVVVPFGFGLDSYGEPPSLGADLPLALVIAAITAVAFYRYAFRSREIWQEG
ncbi:MAG: hypothetical protein K0R03_2670 [Moraxellaceae bacterium]|jgi:hypothetical protein|nr:hypothetical protein [Moraxellaceae bacterium]